MIFHLILTSIPLPLPSVVYMCTHQSMSVQARLNVFENIASRFETSNAAVTKNEDLFEEQKGRSLSVEVAIIKSEPGEGG